MRRALMLAVVVLMAGCAESPPVPPAAVTAATLAPPPPRPVEPAPRRETVIPVPQPKPKTVVYLDVVPPDAVLEQAVREALQAKAGHLELRRAGGAVPADATQLALRHFRWNEDERTEAMRTITYRPDQVTGQTMPAGAVYQVDHVSGKATVGFSFRLSVERGGRKLAESEVSDRVEAPWSTCRLARVVEASGAAKAARVVANPEMQSLCTGKAATSVSPTGLTKLADAVLALPLNGK